MEELRGAHREPGKLESMVKAAISGALLGVAEKYELPKAAIEEFMANGFVERYAQYDSAIVS
jgi:hypothetical protein